jgi:hypothetical protein
LLIQACAFVALFFTAPVHEKTGAPAVASRLLEDIHLAQKSIARGHREQALMRVADALRRARDARTVGLSNGTLVLPVVPETPANPEVQTQYASIQVDVVATEKRLQAARTALEHGDLRRAGGELKAAQADVAMVSVETELPIVQARKNLRLAITHVQQQDWNSAQAALRASVQALNKLAGEHAGQARQLSREISRFADNIQHHKGAAKTIDAWWERIAGWQQPSTVRDR